MLIKLSYCTNSSSLRTWT